MYKILSVENRKTFEIKLEEFAGPMQLLLDLIEKEELEITKVSLARVTDEYIKHMEAHEVPPEDLADFLMIAARLMYLKSCTILPIEQEIEYDEPDLALQLKMYKEFVDASHWIEGKWETNAMFGRERAKTEYKKSFLPPARIGEEDLRVAFRSVLRRLEPFYALREAAVRRVVSVQERIRSLRDMIRVRSSFLFLEAASDAQSKADVAVSFVALLELMKQKAVTTIQKGVFADITIKKAD